MWGSASRIDTPTVLEVLNFYGLPRGVIQFPTPHPHLGPPPSGRDAGVDLLRVAVERDVCHHW